MRPLTSPLEVSFVVFRDQTRSLPIVVTLMVPTAEYVALKVPSFGRSAAIAAAPKAMPVLNVKAVNLHVRDCIELSSP